MDHHPPFTPLTKDAVAEVLGVSGRTIENWVNEGRMVAPAAIGGRIFWHPDLFYRWLDQCLREAQPVNVSVPTKPVAAPKGADVDKSGLRMQKSRRLARIESAV